MDHSTGKLYTDLYCKPADAHNYLPADSHHPSHCITSLPYSQILRIKRICTKEEDFIKHTDDTKSYFLRQGYSQGIFDNAFSKVQTKTREEILYGARATPTMEATPIPLITTYGNGMPNVTKIMHKHWNVLLSSPIAKETMPSKPMVAYRRPKNIRHSPDCNQLPPR